MSGVEQTSAAEQPKEIVTDVASALTAVDDQGKKPAPLEIGKFSDKEQAEIRKRAAAIPTNSTAALVLFGGSSLSAVNAKVDTVLKAVRSCQAGSVGELFTGLKNDVRKLDLGLLDPNGNESWLARFPIVGEMFSKMRAFVEQYETLAKKLEYVEDRIYNTQDMSLKNITTLDSLQEGVKLAIREFEMDIAAGEMRATEIGNELRRVQAESRAKLDDADLAEQVAQTNDTFMRLMRRIYNLHLARTDSRIMLPQIRIAKEAVTAVIELCQNAINFTLPAFKRNAILAIAAHDVDKAQQLLKAVKHSNEELRRLGSELLQKASEETKKMQQEGFINIQTLKDSYQKLVETIENGLRIDSESLAKFAENEQALQEIERGLNAVKQRTALEEAALT